MIFWGKKTLLFVVKITWNHVGNAPFKVPGTEYLPVSLIPENTCQLIINSEFLTKKSKQKNPYDVHLSNKCWVTNSPAFTQIIKLETILYQK